MPFNRIEALQKQIEDVKKRWPAHTPSPTLMAQLDELEEALANEIAREKAEMKAQEPGAQEIRFQAIGHVENEFDMLAALDQIAAVESRLILDPALTDGLQGLQVGQQIMVIFYFHLSKDFALMQHPRGDPGREKRGVFALCSPRRPNPIGVTVVELTGMDGNVLSVRGLDALNGTPVLDIKPA